MQIAGQSPLDADDNAAARRVVDRATEALVAIGRWLDGAGREPFARAVDLLALATGRVIVTGMGKSGHVAAKIAATLASTGTPAQFVHPGEASHGDLGMVTRADAVLALSKSGETAELGDLVTHCRRYAIPLVAVTGRLASSLGEAADVTVTLPAVEEACPNGLAPTTSTTAMLVLGDALAVTLLARRRFSTEDFQMLHPGGSLGHRLKRVADLMHRAADMPLVPAEAPMAEALIEISAKRLGCVGVVDRAGVLIGIVTDGDLRRHMTGDLPARPVADVMTRWPVTIRPSALVAEAIQVMNARRITSLFAVEDGRPVGALHIHDCLGAGLP